MQKYHFLPACKMIDRLFASDEVSEISPNFTHGKVIWFALVVGLLDLNRLFFAHFRQITTRLDFRNMFSGKFYLCKNHVHSGFSHGGQARFIFLVNTLRILLHCHSVIVNSCSTVLNVQ